MLNNAAAYIIILFNAVVYIIVYKMNIKKSWKHKKVWKNMKNTHYGDW